MVATITYPSMQNVCYVEDGLDVDSWPECVYNDDNYLVVSQKLLEFRNRCLKVITNHTIAISTFCVLDLMDNFDESL